MYAVSGFGRVRGPFAGSKTNGLATETAIGRVRRTHAVGCVGEIVEYVLFLRLRVLLQQ